MAIAGFWNASSLSKRRLDAEERRRFADRKAAAYQQATAFLLYRKTERSYQLNISWLDKKARRRAQKILARYDQRQWFAPKPRSARCISALGPPDPERITDSQPGALPAGGG